MKVRVGVLKNTYFPAYNNCSISGWTPRKHCLLPGSKIEISRELFRVMNVSHEIIAVDTDEDLFNLSLNNSIDAVLFNPIRTNLNLTAFDFSYPAMFQPYAFAYTVLDTSFDGYIKAMTRPFSPCVWKSICTIIILLLATWVIIRFKNYSKCVAENITDIPFEFFSFFQGEVKRIYILNISLTKKFFFVSMYLFAIIISASYQNRLMIVFREGKRTVPFTTLSELVTLLEQDTIKIVTDDDEWQFFQRVKNRDGELFIKMNEIFKKHSYLKVNSKEEVVKYLQTGKYVLPSFAFELEVNYSEIYCQLIVVAMNNEKQWFSYPFTKNSTYLPGFNRAVISSWSMINFYLRKYNLTFPEQSTCAEDEPSRFALSLKNFVTPYILLYIGLAVSVIIFLFELLLNVKSKQYNFPFV